MGWETEIPDVVAGQPITSVWGNAIRDSIVHVVATTAALPSTGVSNGDTVYVTALNRLVTRTNNRWYVPLQPFTGIAKTTSAAGQADVTAADLGLNQVTFGLASPRWAAGTGAAAPLWSASRFVGGQIEVRVWAIVSAAPANYVGAVTIDGYATGYLTA